VTLVKRVVLNAPEPSEAGTVKQEGRLRPMMIARKRASSNLHKYG
jgi:hypothetical protein